MADQGIEKLAQISVHYSVDVKPHEKVVIRGPARAAVHWDVLKDMKKGGEIYADDKLFYKDGKFLV